MLTVEHIQFAVSRGISCFCIVASLLIAGCGGSSIKNLVTNPGLELPLESDGLPRDWSIDVSSGDYRVGGSELAHSGKSALVLAGSGGAAEIETNPFPVTGGSILECEAWLRPELLEKAESSASVKFADVEDSRTVRSAIVKLDSKKRDWQHIHFYCRANQQSSPLSATFTIHLSGPGLVRIDDVQIREHPSVIANTVLLDGGFEHPDAKGAFPDWNPLSDSKKYSIEQYSESPKSGKSCVRIQGAAGWTVMTTRKAILPKSGRIFVQGFIRSPEGKGIIKIDYLKDGKCFESSNSAEIHSNEWSLAAIRSNAEFAAQADEVHLTLGASNSEGSYTVDFDEVEVVTLR